MSKCAECGSEKVYLTLAVNGVEEVWWCFPCVWVWKPELELRD